MTFINTKNGEVLRRTMYSKKGEVISTKAIKKMILESPEDIISIHNHPTSKIPSPQDLYSASKRGQKYGLIIGYDGNVYRYFA